MASGVDGGDPGGLKAPSAVAAALRLPANESINCERCATSISSRCR